MEWGFDGNSSQYSLYDNTIGLRTINTYSPYTLSGTFIMFVPPVLDPRKFTLGTSDPPSPSHDSSVESVTPKVNPTQLKNPPNSVPNVPAETDSDTSSSDSSSSYLSDSSDGEYSKCRQR